MLPPFLPPSARSASESLPLITEFVVTKTEHSFGKSWDANRQGATAVLESAAVESLPPITQFLATDIQPPQTPNVTAEAPASEPVEEQWMNEERNSFDWQSVANLTVRQHDTTRAEDEWATTDWNQATHSEAEKVAALLTQIARRVRGGELKVESTRGMSAEAALAATLAALLRNDD